MIVVGSGSVIGSGIVVGSVVELMGSVSQIVCGSVVVVSSGSGSSVVHSGSGVGSSVVVSVSERKQ